MAHATEIRRERADSMSTAVPEKGSEYTYERTFTVKEVHEFGELSGDQQAIHTEPNEDGELVVQGLLITSLLTKIGGDLNYLARRMGLLELTLFDLLEHIEQDARLLLRVAR